MNPKSTGMKQLLTGVGVILLGVAIAPAAVSWSGELNGGAGIAIPTNFAGVYVDIATLGTETPSNDPDVVTSDSYRVGYSAPATWDVNFFFGGIGIAYSPTFQPFVDDTVGNLSQILNVTVGTVIADEAAARTMGVPNYGGSGKSNGSSVGDSHYEIPTVDIHPAYSAFTPGDSGYIAFVLNPGANEQYGWMQVTLTNNGTLGTIHQWAYSDSDTFTVGQIPEPGCVALLVVGACLMRRRRV